MFALFFLWVIRVITMLVEQAVELRRAVPLLVVVVIFLVVAFTAAAVDIANKSELSTPLHCFLSLPQ